MSYKQRHLIAALLASSAVLAGCGGTEGDEAASTTTPAPIATATTAPPTTPAKVAPAPPADVPKPAPEPLPQECQPAPDQYVAIINAAFSNSAETLTDVFAVEGPKDLLYIAGNIMEGEKRVSSADVWIARGPAVFSLSSDARKRTMLVDGRDALNASAGDEWGAKVADCVSLSVRNRNRSGGN